MHKEIRRISPGFSSVPERDRDGLREDAGVRVEKLARVTKFRSSALSCSAVPEARGWNPMMCERLLNGMRRKSPPAGHYSSAL
jgi:hypothetical protein